jgi:hypothetical protein
MLSRVAPKNPMNKDAVIVPLKKQRPKLGGWMLDSDDSDNVGDNNYDDKIFVTPKCNKKAGKPKHQKKGKQQSTLI